MSALRSRLGLGSLLVAGLIVLALGVGTVYAAIPNGNGTYYACLTKSSGVVRIINYPKVKCAKGERLIKWSQQGPAGPQGAQGPAGPADWNAIPNIPAGFADGVDNGILAITVQEVVGASVNIAGTGTGTASVGCTGDSKVISGGFDSNTPQMNIYASKRAGNGWLVAAYNPTANPQSITALAYCMRTEPASAFNIAKRAKRR